MPAGRDDGLSRLFVADIVRILLEEERIESISPSTVWRILDRDALKPWRQHSWIFPRDPLFYERAAPVLDLYHRIWRRKPLRDDEYVISADEKTGLQVLRRLHPSVLVPDGNGLRVEHEYVRKGVWAYLAAWDVHHGKLFDRVEEKTGIEPFGRLIDQVMRTEPYRSARRVFWILDGGSSHHRATFAARLSAQYPNAVAVHLPVHASWLNQVEIYFSILQRKALTPVDFANPKQARRQLLAFGDLFRQHATPFQWNYTRAKLRDFLAKLPPLITATESARSRRRAA